MGFEEQSRKNPMDEFILNEDQEPIERRADELREELKTADHQQLAFNTGAGLLKSSEGVVFFEFPYWGNPVELSCQDFYARDPETSHPLPPVHQAMILYYFVSSRGSPPPREWISFSELADGQFYNTAFLGYTSQKLLQRFWDDYKLFEKKCLGICGEKIDFGDGAFKFQILPQVAILAVYWKGDEEFPPSYKILFQNTADYHLPTDACAILGSMLTGKLIVE
jgi:hypothetical protein